MYNHRYESYKKYFMGFPGDLVVKKKQPTCQYMSHKRCKFDPWVRKIPWRRKWPPTLIFLPGKSHGQRSLVNMSFWKM